MNRNAVVYNIPLLQQEMERQFLNYKDIAEKTGLPYMTVYRVFTTMRKARIRKPQLILQIASALKVPKHKAVKPNPTKTVNRN